MASEYVHPDDAKHKELWDELRRARDIIHRHGEVLAVLSSRVNSLEEVEKSRFGKMAAVMGAIVTVSTLVVQGLFWLLTRLPKP